MSERYTITYSTVRYHELSLTPDELADFLNLDAEELAAIPEAELTARFNPDTDEMIDLIGECEDSEYYDKPSADEPTEFTIARSS